MPRVVDSGNDVCAMEVDPHYSAVPFAAAAGKSLSTSNARSLCRGIGPTLSLGAGFCSRTNQPEPIDPSAWVFGLASKTGPTLNIVIDFRPSSASWHSAVQRQTQHAVPGTDIFGDIPLDLSTTWYSTSVVR